MSCARNVQTLRRRIRWLPYFLNPDTPEEGEPYRPFLERKFGGPEKLAQLWSQIAAAGRTAGIEFAFERIEVRANTLRAHRLIHRAQKSGNADALVERLFAAHFLQGENIGDAEVLARLAGECGEDGQRPRWPICVPERMRRRCAPRPSAASAWASPVCRSSFSMAAYGIGGAQPPEVLLDALRQSLNAS